MAKIKWIGAVGNPGSDPVRQAKRKAHLDEVAREATIHREDRQRIDDATLDKFAEAVGIPQEERSVVYRSVGRAILELQRGMKAENRQLRRTPTLTSLGKYQAAVDKVRELLAPEYAPSTRAGKYAAANNVAVGKERELLMADDYARAAVLASIRSEDDNVIIDEDTTTFTCNGRGKSANDVIIDGADFVNKLNFAIERTKQRVGKALKDKGRPHGAQGDTAIDLFLSSLISYIRKMGGHIATSRTQESSPTYIGKAVEILRPFLPGNFPVTESLERKFETIGTKKARPLRTAMPTRKTVKKRDV